MVGCGDRRVSCRSSRRIPEKFGLGSQRMDGGRTCHGLDQHENYSRYGLLCHRYSDWHLQAMVGKGSHGPEVATRPRQLSHYPQAPTGVAFDETILSRQ